MAYEKAVEGLVGIAALGITFKMLENVMDDSHHHHSHAKSKQFSMW